MKSSNEEIVLSRDSKEFFERLFVKVFIEIESTWRHKVKEQAPQLTCGKTLKSSHRRCCIRKVFLKLLQYPKETPLSESIFKTFADL